MRGRDRAFLPFHRPFSSTVGVVAELGCKENRLPQIQIIDRFNHQMLDLEKSGAGWGLPSLQKSWVPKYVYSVKTRHNASQSALR